ncbi:MAG: metalloregulator ArsR/SmtB family transcription factor [Nostoc sp.]|uniref:ArsR/SmtB family transcription factor n=1 Tax=Nostoc sp. TaxID=1180 RepID=UPI002FF0DFC9
MPKLKPDDICQVRCFNDELVVHVRDAMPMEETLEEAKTLFTALADKSRLKILHALKDRQELCVCDIAEVLGVQVSVASHHLRKLRDLKVLKYRNDGKLVYYSLRDQFVGEILDLVLQKIVR